MQVDNIQDFQDLILKRQQNEFRACMFGSLNGGVVVYRKRASDDLRLVCTFPSKNTIGWDARRERLEKWLKRLKVISDLTGINPIVRDPLNPIDPLDSADKFFRADVGNLLVCCSFNGGSDAEQMEEVARMARIASGIFI